MNMRQPSDPGKMYPFWRLGKKDTPTRDRIARAVADFKDSTALTPTEIQIHAKHLTEKDPLEFEGIPIKKLDSSFPTNNILVIHKDTIKQRQMRLL